MVTMTHSPNGQGYVVKQFDSLSDARRAVTELNHIDHFWTSSDGIEFFRLRIPAAILQAAEDAAHASEKADAFTAYLRGDPIPEEPNIDPQVFIYQGLVWILTDESREA